MIKIIELLRLFIIIKKKRINHHIITFHDINYIKYISKEFGFKFINNEPINKDESILIFQKL